jgi:hypothetical protein
MNRRTFLFAALGGCALALAFMLLTSGTTSSALAMSQAPAPSVQAADDGVTSSIPTTITLASSPNPVSVGQTVNITATVFIPPRSGIPTGTIQFKVDGVNFGAAVSLSGRKASVSTSWSAEGAHNLTAVYSGDSLFSTNTSSTMFQLIIPSYTPGTNNENSFILSNEPPDYLIHKLVTSGFGSSSLYTVTLYLKTLPGADTILTDAFENALASSPATSEIFTLPLNQFDFDGAVAINTDGTAQFVDIFGQDYTGKPNTTTLKTGNISLRKTNFVTSNNPEVPLTSWNYVFRYGGGLYYVTTAYHAFTIAWGDSYSLYLPMLVR